VAKRSRAKLEEILKRDAPGMKIAKVRAADAPAKRATPDAVSPDIDELRRKYGVDKTRGTADAVRVRSARPAQDHDESEFVLLTPSDGADGPGAQPKAAIVSRGRIIARQG